jgi:hypothetical protein
VRREPSNQRDPETDSSAPQASAPGRRHACSPERAKALGYLTFPINGRSLALQRVPATHSILPPTPPPHTRSGRVLYRPSRAQGAPHTFHMNNAAIHTHDGDDVRLVTVDVFVCAVPRSGRAHCRTRTSPALDAHSLAVTPFRTAIMVRVRERARPHPGPMPLKHGVGFPRPPQRPPVAGSCAQCRCIKLPVAAGHRSCASILASCRQSAGQALAAEYLATA